MAGDVDGGAGPRTPAGDPARLEPPSTLVAHELNDELLQAVCRVQHEKITAIVEQNPELLDALFSFQHEKSKRPMRGSLLAASLVLGPRSQGMSVVKLLVEQAADVNTPSSFLAGSSKMLWRGPPIHDAIRARNLEAVKYLVEKRVDPCEGSQFGTMDGASVLWQASYAGTPDIVEFLLEKSAACDLETTAPWQDNPSHELTPLHVASRCGHVEVVRRLIEEKAEFDKTILLQKGKSTPMTDAMERGHIDVVRLLVARDATVPRRALFQLNNEVVIAAVAEGLASAHEESVKRCLSPPVWLGMFLKTPGRAPIHALNAIFRRRVLDYFDADGERRNASIALFEDRQVNFAEGCDYSDFEEAYIDRNTLGDDGQQLLMALQLEVPKVERSLVEVEGEISDDPSHAHEFWHRSIKRTKTSSRLKLTNAPEVRSCCCRCDWSSCLRRAVLRRAAKASMAPAAVQQCLLPKLLDTEHVLFAIAHTNNEQIFDLQACEAIVSLSWNRTRHLTVLDTIIGLLLAGLYSCITLLLASETGSASWGALLAVGLLLVTFNGACATLEMVGMWNIGRVREYVCSWSKFRFWCRIFLSYVLLLWLASGPSMWHEPTQVFRFLLATQTLWSWLRILTDLSGYKFVGIRTLAIFRALSAANIFIIIIFVFCIGFAHAYLALGLRKLRSPFFDFSDSFFDIYRLGFLAEVEPKAWTEDMNDSTRFLAQTLAMGGGLMMAIVMMNIFIGVLSESYARAYKNRHRSFQWERARIALKHSMRARACRRYRCCCCFARAWRRRPESSKDEFLWYCTRRTHAASHSHVEAQISELQAMVSTLQHGPPDRSEGRTDWNADFCASSPLPAASLPVPTAPEKDPFELSQTLFPGRLDEQGLLNVPGLARETSLSDTQFLLRREASTESMSGALKGDDLVVEKRNPLGSSFAGPLRQESDLQLTAQHLERELFSADAENRCPSGPRIGIAPP